MGYKQNTKRVSVPRKTKRGITKITLEEITLIVLFMVLMFVGYKSLTRIYIGNLTLADDFYVQKVVYRGKIGIIKPIQKPENLPTFETAKDAIDYVSNLEYSQFISDPKDVLEEKAGSCLGKARLLYFISKEQGFEMKIKKSGTHVRVEIDKVLYEL